MAEKNDTRKKLPPWMKGKKKSEQGDVDQDEKAAKHEEKEPDQIDEENGGDEQQQPQKPSGPSIGKPFRFHTVVKPHAGAGEQQEDGASHPRDRAKNIASRHNGKPHPAMSQFRQTVEKLIQANFPTDADTANVCGMVKNRWLSQGGNVHAAR